MIGAAEQRLQMQDYGNLDDGSLGSNQLRSSAAIQSEIDLEKLRTDLQQAQHARILEQKKFMDDLFGEQSKPDGSRGTKSPTPQPQSIAPSIIRAVRPSYVTDVYEFGHAASARISLGGSVLQVKPGTVLADGRRVTAVTTSGVTIRDRHGHKTVLPILGSSSLTDDASPYALPNSTYAPVPASAPISPPAPQALPSPTTPTHPAR